VRYDPVYEERMYRPAVREYYSQKGYYNYGFWESDTRDQGEACRNLVSKMLDQLHGNRGRLLEVACGLGGTTTDIVETFPASEVLAVDLSARNVHNVRRNAPGCHGAIMDGAVLAVGDEQVDHIMSVEAAFHFDTRERFLEECLRTLKPGGRLVLSDILFRRVRSRFLPRGNHLDGPEGYEQLLRRVGFRDFEVVDVTEPCWGGFRRNLRSWGWATFKATKGSAPATLRVRRLLGLALWLGSLRMALRYYLLVAATK
jgi:MPBQ/MSBQ methyltransferase